MILRPGTKVRHRYDGMQGTVVTVHGALYFVRFADQTTDLCLLSDLSVPTVGKRRPPKRRPHCREL